MATILKEVSRISGLYGLDGEEKVAKELAEQLPESFLVINSPRLAMNDNVVDIDHIVITPAAIFVIESKNMNGRISGGLMGNWTQERISDGKKEYIKIGNPAAQVNQYTKVVRDYLKFYYLQKYQQQKNFKMEPIVVFTHEHSNINGIHYTSRGRVGKVRVLLLKDLVAHIMSFDKEYMSLAEMHEVADILVPQDQREQTGIYPVLNDLPKESFRSRYQILEELGRGTSGVVFRAFDSKLDLEVAVKRLYTGQTSEKYKRWKQIARISARLNHANIVRIHDYYEEDGEFYLVMDLVQGLTLSEALEQKQFGWREIYDIMEQICGALDYAHREGVIHLDLKGDNILIDEKGQVHVTDFGIAALELEGGGKSIGTPLYMAPEQVRGEKGDKASDWFAAGVILYQLITGHFPFYGRDLQEVGQDILYGQAPPLTRWREDAPPELQRVLSKALAKEGHERYQSGRELLADLKAALGEELASGQGLSGQWFANQLWLKFWRDDKKKFYLVVALTALVFGWMFSLQLYIDRKFPQTGTNTAGELLQDNRLDTTLITNENIQQSYGQVEKWAGRKVRLTGRLEKLINRTEDYLLLQMAVSDSKGAITRILVQYNGDSHQLLQQEESLPLVRLAGILASTTTVDPRNGEIIKIPLIINSEIEPIELWNSLSPTKYRLEIKQVLVRHGIEVELERLEIAEGETRLYLRVKNRSLQKHLVSLANPQARQGKNIIYQLYHSENNYQFELQPEQEVKGQVILGPLDVLQRQAEISLGNNFLGQEPWVFSVKW